MHKTDLQQKREPWEKWSIKRIKRTKRVKRVRGSGLLRLAAELRQQGQVLGDSHEGEDLVEVTASRIAVPEPDQIRSTGHRSPSTTTKDTLSHFLYNIRFGLHKSVLGGGSNKKSPGAVLTFWRLDKFNSFREIMVGLLSIILMCAFESALFLACLNGGLCTPDNKTTRRFWHLASKRHLEFMETLKDGLTT